MKTSITILHACVKIMGYYVYKSGEGEIRLCSQMEMIL